MGEMRFESNRFFFLAHLCTANVVLHSMRKFESFKPALPEMVFQQKTL